MAITAAQLQIALSTKGEEAVKASFAQVGGAGQALERRFASASSAIGGTASRLKSALLSTQTLVAGIATGIGVGLVKGLVDDFGESEQAVIKLNAALRVTGRYSADGTRAIQQMAAQMQRTTTADGDAVIAATSTLAQLATQLTAKQLAQSQKAIIGISQTFGLSLESSAQLIGKTLSGTTNMLSRYGIAIDITKGQQDRFNELLQKTNGFFGVAEGAAHSVSGQLTQAAIAFGDLREALGQVIVGIFQFDTQGGSLRDRIKDMTTSVTQNIGAWIMWGQRVVEGVRYVGVGLFDLSRILWNLVEIAAKAAALIVTEIGAGVETAVNATIDVINALISDANLIPGVHIAAIDHITEHASAASASLRASIVGDAHDIGTAWTNLNGAAQRFADQWVASAERAKHASADVSTRGGGANLAQSMVGYDAAHPDKQLLAQQKQINSRIHVVANGVVTAAQGVASDMNDKLRTTFAEGVGNSLVDGIEQGFTALFQSGSIGAGFAALGRSLLSGIGGAMVAFGKAALTASTIMSTIVNALKSLNPVVGIVASLALIAAGTALQSLGGPASSSFGNMGAFAGGGSGIGAISTPVTRPNDILRVTMGSSPAATTAAGMQPVQPVHITVIGPNDPSAQRTITKLLTKAGRRGLTT